MDKSTTYQKLRPKLRTQAQAQTQTATLSHSDGSLECNICLEDVDHEYKLVRYGCCEGKMCRNCCVALINYGNFACPCCREPSPFATSLKPTIEPWPISNHQSIRMLAAYPIAISFEPI